MKIQFLTGFLLTGLVCLPLDMISQPQALAASQPAPKTQSNSTRQYQEFMREGYKLTGRRNWRPALQNFQQALQIRPGDPYATKAVRNVNGYIQRRNHFAYNGMGKPNRTGMAATRGQKPFALIPPDDKTPRTTAGHPTFFVYINQDYVGKPLKFVLYDGNSSAKALYETEVKAVGQAGIVAITIPVDRPELKPGKEYTFDLLTLKVRGNPVQRLHQNKIQRVQDEYLAEAIQQTPNPLEQLPIYKSGEYWEDALTVLAGLRRNNPNDPQIQEHWKEFLNSVELGHIADQPLL
jgi:hypothetical protein